MVTFHHILMKSHIKINKAVMSKAAEAGLTAGQPKILEYLKEVGKADQKTIALHCEIEPATVGSILFRMERIGLVFRERGEEDRRAVNVRLTADGVKAAEKVESIFAMVERQALRGLSDQEKQTAVTILQKIYNNLKSSEDVQ